VSELLSVHVERTPVDAELRWVTHHTELQASSSGLRAVPTESAIGKLIASGVVAELRVVSDDVVVQFASAVDAARLAPEVNEAIIRALTDHEPWLFESVDGPVVPTKESVEAIIESAVGALLTSHGGSIEVVSVTNSTAYVRLHGACRGCAGAGSTLHGLVRTALVRAHSGLVDVVDVADVVEVAEVADKPDDPTNGTRVFLSPRSLLKRSRSR
jgi:NFU1 iron-sulfur cluster scaffold homolog, mitochondrial